MVWIWSESSFLNFAKFSSECLKENNPNEVKTVKLNLQIKRQCRGLWLLSPIEGSGVIGEKNQVFINYENR